jgi:NAD(P)H-hydrate epimerase
MKILPIEKVREADAYTIKNEPIEDIDLMERAATQLFNRISDMTDLSRPIKTFCGLGNNGGDGFAVSRMLANAGHKVTVYVVRYSDKMSPSCKTNYERIKNVRNATVIELNKEDELPEIETNDIIIDAIFGSGLKRPVKGFIARVIDYINKSSASVISIDAPSGFFCDTTNTTNDGSIIEATVTLTFQFPKYGFLFPENETYAGNWEVLPIGLHPDFISDVNVDSFLIESSEVTDIRKIRTKFSHKGTYGHGLLISGGYGKMGAAVLGSKAALRAGAGLITTHIPAKGYTILQTSAPEAMVSIDIDEYIFSEVPHLTKYNAIAVGPGIGTDKQTAKALKLLIQNTGVPIIFDADAINILAENKTWISFIPQNSIFTPHPKEFERLIGKSSDDFERNKMQREFSIKHNCYVILKGAHTAITTPAGNCYFNTTGNPGMATGGSGDVLTGILLGLLAQGYSPLETSLLGVYIHGLAGDIAGDNMGYEALIAGDIITNIGGAYKLLDK